jgi:hypothetical protein
MFITDHDREWLQSRAAQDTTEADARFLKALTVAHPRWDGSQLRARNRSLDSHDRSLLIETFCVGTQTAQVQALEFSNVFCVKFSNAICINTIDNSTLSWVWFIHDRADWSDQLLHDFVQSKVNAGWSAFLLTLMFSPLSGHYLSKLHQMKGSIERFYSRLLTRLVRYPSKGELPILIGMADFPVPKRRKKSSVMDVIINDGLHFHSILLIPPKSRLRSSLDKHLEENVAFILEIEKRSTASIPSRLQEGTSTRWLITSSNQ